METEYQIAALVSGAIASFCIWILTRESGSDPNKANCFYKNCKKGGLK